jgi:hypothetical protein
MKVVLRTAVIHVTEHITCKCGVHYHSWLQRQHVNARVFDPDHSGLHTGTAHTINAGPDKGGVVLGALTMSNACSLQAPVLSNCFLYMYILC